MAPQEVHKVHRRTKHEEVLQVEEGCEEAGPEEVVTLLEEKDRPQLDAWATSTQVVVIFWESCIG